MDALDAFSGDYSQKMAELTLRKRIPFGGTFELLPYCNMQCKMCYIVHERPQNWKNTLKTVDFWDNLADQAIDAGMVFLLVTGGEPFLYPGFKELMERLNKKPIHIALNTNATLINRERAAWLADLGLNRVNITLYGTSNETYEKLCGNPKGFDQVTQAFRLLNEYHIPFRIHVSLTPDNYCDFDKFTEIGNQFQAPMQKVYYMFPPYRKDQGFIQNSDRFTPEEASEVALRILKEKIKNPTVLRMQLEATCAALDNPKLYSLYGRDEILCRGGLASFWVDWRGHLDGCGIHTPSQIDMATTPFAEGYREVVKLTENTKTSAKCAFCNYRVICPVCPAAAFCETGDVAGAPEYLCRHCEIYADLLRKEYKRLCDEQLGGEQNTLR